MVTLSINGRKVQVDDSFRNMSPEQQEATVNEIASSMGGDKAPMSLDEYYSSGIYAGEYNPLGSIARSLDAASTAAGNSLTFGFGDEVSDIWGGGDSQRARQEELEASNPVSSIVGGVGGGLVGMNALQGSGATLMGRFGTDAMTGVAGLLARTGLAGAEGAGYGALSAYGNDQDISTGAILGGIGGAGGNLIGEGVQSALNSRKLQEMVPTVDDLKAQASSLYDAAEKNGVIASPQMTRGLANDIRDIARGEELITPKGRISEAYPRAAEALKLVDDYADTAMNPKQMQVVRETLADARNSTQGKEKRIASMMLRKFDDFTDPLAPELEQARKVSQRAFKGQDLEKLRDLGEVRASQFSASGSENAMRTEYRQLDRAIAKGTEQGWSPAEIQAIQNVSRGTTGQKLARNVGRFAPTGPVSFGVTAGIPFGVGNAIGGPALGATLAAGAAGLGYGGRAVASALQNRNIQIAELLARNGGSLPVVNDSGTRKAIVDALIATVNSGRSYAQ